MGVSGARSSSSCGLTARSWRLPPASPGSRRLWNSLVCGTALPLCLRLPSVSEWPCPLCVRIYVQIPLFIRTPVLLDRGWTRVIFFFTCPHYGKYPGPGSNLSHSCDLCFSCGSTIPVPSQGWSLCLHSHLSRCSQIPNPRHRTRDRPCAIRGSHVAALPLDCAPDIPAFLVPITQPSLILCPASYSVV